jgi:hypothetical protein
VREKRSSLLGHTEVVYTEASTSKELHPFQIVATPFGLTMRGSMPVVGQMQELDPLARTIDLAWEDHRALKPKLSTLADGVQLELL